MSELSEWALVIVTLGLLIATVVLGYYTKIMGRVASELNIIEKERDAEKQLEKRKKNILEVKVVANEIMKITAGDVSRKLASKEIPEIQIKQMEKLLDYIDYLGENKNIIVRNIAQILVTADSIRTNSGIILTEQAMNSMIKQIQNELLICIGNWRVEISSQ